MQVHGTRDSYHEQMWMTTGFGIQCQCFWWKWVITTQQRKWGLSIELPWKWMFLTFVGFWSMINLERHTQFLCCRCCCWPYWKGLFGYSLISQGFVQHWSHNFACSHGRGGGPHSGLCWTDGFETKKKWKTYRIPLWWTWPFQEPPESLNHPEVTLRPLDATSRNIWIIWAMRCYTSRRGPCQAVPGGFRLGLQVFMWFVHAVMSGDISDTNGEGLCSLHNTCIWNYDSTVYYDIWYVVAGWHNCTTRKSSITVSSCLWSFLGLMSPCQGRNCSLASRCGKL